MPTGIRLRDGIFCAWVEYNHEVRVEAEKLFPGRSPSCEIEVAME